MALDKRMRAGSCGALWDILRKWDFIPLVMEIDVIYSAFFKTLEEQMEGCKNGWEREMN